MRAFIAIAFVFITLVSNAQNPTLVVEGTTPNLYINHTVAPKESFYSVARVFNLGAGVLADFNKSNLQTGLQIGQTIKVPLVNQNLEINGKKDAGETLIPLYHVVAKNETLFRISLNNNKVPVASIKQWNGMASDNVVPGTSLIVGYLKVKNEQLSNLTGFVPAGNIESTPVVAQKEPDFKPVVAAKPEPVAQVENTAIVTEKEVKTEEPVVERTRRAETPRQVETQTETPVAAAAPAKPDILAPVVTTTPEEGFFATNFTDDAQEKTLDQISGDAGTFKSTSGWQNKKYYALMNEVEPGTIIKISTAEKVVYARVLGSLPDMKEDRSLILRVSNSAASYLGKIDPKFPVQVSYYK